MKRFPARSAALIGIAAVLVGLSATPASALPPARALSAGSSMYAVGCDGPPDLQLLSIDATTAAATIIGTGANIDGSTCALQSAWDAITHTAYYSTLTLTNVDSLVSVNLTTGVSTKVAAFTVNGATTNVDAIAIGKDGAAYALSGGELLSLNLATAVLAPVAAVTGPPIYGFAADPTSGAFFAIDYNGLISSIDVTTGALTTVGQTTFTPGPSTYSLQIDSNGIMWVENDATNADLWSVDRANVAASGILSGTIAVAGSLRYTESLLIVPAVIPAITSAAPTGSLKTGAAFLFTVAASGTSPVAFSITAGTLPTGLTLNPTSGVISGTPTTAGSFSYTVTATNAAGVAAASYTQLVTLAIHLPIVSG